MPEPHDSELVARSLRGDQRAFRDLIGRHHAVAFAAVRSVLGDRDEVPDVMQVVYLKAYQGLAGFRGDARFSTWLYQIARREALDVSSKRRYDMADIDTVEIAAPAHHGPDAATTAQSEKAWIERAMGELDETYRTVLELRYMAEKSYEEIGRIMGIPEGTAKTYVHRAKVELKRILSRPAWRTGTASERNA